MTEALLELAGVVKTYPATPEPLRVLVGVDFVLEAGSSAAIVGPSGCGKSTLLNLMGTLDRPDSGTIRIAGEDITALRDAALARLRNRTIGFVFQLHHLLPQCTILENVLIPTLPQSQEERKDAHQRALLLLERVGLSDRWRHRPGELSGGECQRTAVARALINRPALLLADEPTGNLDAATGEEIIKLLFARRAETGATLLIITHDASLAARCERVLTMADGVIVSDTASAA